MGLRNAFESLATDSLLRRLLVQLHFARTSADQLRAVVDSGTVNTVTNWSNNNGYVTWYAGTGAPSTMDPREQMKAASRANFQQVRATRWSIT